MIVVSEVVDDVARGVTDASSELDVETELVLSDDPVAETDDNALVAGERDEVTDIARLGDGNDVFDEVVDSDDDSVNFAEAVSVAEPWIETDAIDAVAEEVKDSTNEGRAVTETDRDDVDDNDASELSREDPEAVPVNVWLDDPVGERDDADDDVNEPVAVSKLVDDAEVVGGREAIAECDDDGDPEDRIDNVADTVLLDEGEASTVLMVDGDVVTEYEIVVSVVNVPLVDDETEPSIVIVDEGRPLPEKLTDGLAVRIADSVASMVSVRVCGLDGVSVPVAVEGLVAREDALVLAEPAEDAVSLVETDADKHAIGERLPAGVTEIVKDRCADPEKSADDVRLRLSLPLGEIRAVAWVENDANWDETGEADTDRVEDANADALADNEARDDILEDTDDRGLPDNECFADNVISAVVDGVESLDAVADTKAVALCEDAADADALPLDCMLAWEDELASKEVEAIALFVSLCTAVRDRAAEAVIVSSPVARGDDDVEAVDDGDAS